MFNQLKQKRLNIEKVKWKNISIGTKNAVGFGLVLMLLCVVVVLSYTGVGRIVNNAGEVISGNILSRMLVEMDLHHRQWVNKVNVFLTDEKVTELDVEIDEHKCAFGKLYYGERRKEAESLVPSLKPYFKQIEEPHRKLHQSAIAISQKYHKTNRALPGFLAATEMDLLKWITKVNEHFLINKSEFSVETDYQKCPLGKWLHGDGAKKAITSHEALSPLIETLKEAHKSLKQSTAEIQKVYARVSESFLTELKEAVDKHRELTKFVAIAIIEESDELGVETDPTECAVGIFLHSKQTASAVKDFPKLKSALEAAKKRHNRVHKATIALEEALNDGDSIKAQEIYTNRFLLSSTELISHLQDAIKIQTSLLKQEPAKRIYETKTKPALNETREALQKIKSETERLLDAADEGKRIYAEVTLPSLQIIQNLLDKMRQEVRGNMITDKAMLKAAQGIRRNVTLVGIIAVVFGVLMSFLIARAISEPITKAVRFAEKMSEGNFTQTLNIDQKDEIGILAGALNKMVANIVRMLKQLLNGIEALSSYSAKLSTISQQMSSVAEETFDKSNAVATSAEEMSTNINSIAASMEQSSTNMNLVAKAINEMSDSVGEIAQNSEKARSITSEAVSQASGASEMIDELGSAAKEIGKVIETITDISEQTNLLALNATIEAARAGEAGKGFAVVANEIKELAKQTAEATQEIKAKINDIQGSSGRTVSEIEQISYVINDVNEIVATIAAAVEEQSVTTKTIANNVSQGSHGMNEVNENVAQSSTVSVEIARDISDVNQAVNETSTSASHVNMSAEELLNLAKDLRKMADKFKV